MPCRDWLHLQRLACFKFSFKDFCATCFWELIIDCVTDQPSTTVSRMSVQTVLNYKFTVLAFLGSMTCLMSIKWKSESIWSNIGLSKFCSQEFRHILSDLDVLLSNPTMKILHTKNCTSWLYLTIHSPFVSKHQNDAVFQSKHFLWHLASMFKCSWNSLQSLCHFVWHCSLDVRQWTDKLAFILLLSVFPLSLSLSKIASGDLAPPAWRICTLRIYVDGLWWQSQHRSYI